MGTRPFSHRCLSSRIRTCIIEVVPSNEKVTTDGKLKVPKLVPAHYNDVHFRSS